MTPRPPLPDLARYAMIAVTGLWLLAMPLGCCAGCLSAENEYDRIGNSRYWTDRNGRTVNAEDVGREVAIRAFALGVCCPTFFCAVVMTPLFVVWITSRPR